MVTNGSYSEIRFSEFLRSAISLQKEALEFAFKVGGEDVLTDGFTDLLKTPETAAVEFVGRGAYRTVVNGLMDIDQFTLTAAGEDILPNELRLKGRDAQFFAHLALQGLFGGLTIVDVSAYGRIPLSWLDILPVWALLQIDFAMRIKHMQMDYGMQQMGTIMTNATGG